MKEINHSERAHALLSPSASSRWLKCTMSIPLSENYPDTTSQFAEEGTQAHELAEWEARTLLELPTEGDKPQAADEDMARHAKDYALYIKEQLTSEWDKVYLEERLHLKTTLGTTPMKGLCFGTADCVIVGADGIIHIIDFKYGKGVEVSAEHNAQMMMYATMALSMFSRDFAEQVSGFKLHIYQPRIGNISTWQISKDELQMWYALSVLPAITSILRQDYYAQAGDHCRWCKHRTSCAVYAQTYYDPVVQAMRLERWSMSKDKIAEVLSAKDDLIKWLGELSDKVLSDILSGDSYKGYKVVEGRSIRTITDKEGAIAYLRSAGYKEADIFKPLELQNLTALQKLMGKKAFDEEMAAFVTKPKGKPTLVTSDDKRPDYVDETEELAIFK